MALNLFLTDFFRRIVTTCSHLFLSSFLSRVLQTNIIDFVFFLLIAVHQKQVREYFHSYHHFHRKKVETFWELFSPFYIISNSECCLECLLYDFIVASYLEHHVLENKSVKINVWDFFERV